MSCATGYQLGFNVIYIVVLFGIVIYLKNYLLSKAKNLATKEDINGITHTVESIKSYYALEVEQVKTTLQRESEVLENRRAVYEELINGLRVFVSDDIRLQQEGNKAKSDFIAAYRRAWIWTPDDVIQKFNEIVDLNLLSTNEAISEKEMAIRATYVQAVIKIRQDAGYLDTKLAQNDYRFFQF